MQRHKMQKQNRKLKSELISGIEIWDERRLVASSELQPCIAVINRRLLPQGIIVYLYDITAQKWYSKTYQRDLYQGAWEYDASFRREVHGFATCRQGRFLYVIGAFVHPVTKKRTIDRLDIHTGVLELVASLDETSLEKGCICAVYMKESSILVVSHDASDYYNPTPPMLHIIDPASGTTRKLLCVGHAPDLLCYRYATCLLQGRLISVGGGDDESGAWEYDVQQQSWRILSNMKQPRERATGVQWDDKAAVVGGHDREHGVDTVEVFDVQSGCWSALPPMQRGRQSANAVVVQETFVVMEGCRWTGIPGENPSYVREIERYNENARRWEMGRLPFAAPVEKIEEVLMPSHSYT